MKFGLISDTHASTSLPYAKKINGGITSDRLEDVISAIKFAGITCLQRDVVDLYILGDLFDKKHPDGGTLVATSKLLRSLADMGLNIHILPGNHDAVDRDGRMYNLQFYQELKIPKIKILEQSILEIAQGLRIHCYPWLPEARIIEQLEKADMGAAGDINIGMIHQTVVGAIGDTGWISDDGIDSKILEKFSTVYSGHYHVPQKHSWGRYLGSPLAFRFGDEAVDKRGFWICDVADGKINEQMIEYNYPRFGSIDINMAKGDILSDVIDVDDPMSDSYGTGVIIPEEWKYVRIKMTGDKSAISASNSDMMRIKDTAQKNGARIVKFDLIPDRYHDIRLEIDPTLDPVNIAKKYAEKMGVDSGVKSVGEDIIKQVMK